MTKKKITLTLGVRPDIIRASLVLKYLERAGDIDVIFIWSGQNYSDNLKDIFFRELHVRTPDILLHAAGKTDAEIVSKVIRELSPVLQKINPVASIFLGDTNTAMGAIAAAQLNIPVFHIEGSWRSFDWRMPEEKIRTTVDHIADIIYAYDNQYKKIGIREGIPSDRIVVVGNPIVDVLDAFYMKRKSIFEKKATQQFFRDRGISDGHYFLLTCHRRENVETDASFDAIRHVLSAAKYPVYFTASYRTQTILQKRKITLPPQVILRDPVGYEEELMLLTHSRGVLTDSGTMSEEACILGIPCLNIRKSTERPQIYDVHAAVKFDPDRPDIYPANVLYAKLEHLSRTPWRHTLGDGHASERIARDIVQRIRMGSVHGFRPDTRSAAVKRAFMEDGIFLTKKEKNF